MMCLNEPKANSPRLFKVKWEALQGVGVDGVGGNRERAAYCFKSSVSEERTH